MSEIGLKTMHRAWGARSMSLLALLLLGCSADSMDGPVEPARVERYGEIEVVSQVGHSRNANTGQKVAYESWSLRWRGQPLVIDSLAGMWLDKQVRSDAFNAIFVLGTGDKPDLLVNVGDPNNASVFHLLHQDGAGLAAPLLCKTFGGDNAVRVLDGQDSGKLFQGPHFQSLDGAGRLLLGSSCILDVASGKAKELPDKPEDVNLPTYFRAMAISPGGQLFVRLGLNSDEEPVVMVADLERGAWSRLPVDLKRMRYSHFEEIDVAWLEYHFQWQRDAGGHERLVERGGFKPLPWRGWYLAGTAQYEVLATEVDSSERLGDFLVRRFQAKRLPGDRSWREGGLQYEVEQEVVNVTGRGFYIAQLGKPYWPGQPGDPKRQMELIHRIGDAFDAELATGMHEAMFVPAPDEH